MKIKNIILAIASIEAVRAKRTGEEIPLGELLRSVTDRVAKSRGDFAEIFSDYTPEDVGGVDPREIRCNLELDYRRAATKIYKAQVKRRRRMSEVRERN